MLSVFAYYLNLRPSFSNFLDPYLPTVLPSPVNRKIFPSYLLSFHSLICPGLQVQKTLPRIPQNTWTREAGNQMQTTRCDTLLLSPMSRSSPTFFLLIRLAIRGPNSSRPFLGSCRPAREACRSGKQGSKHQLFTLSSPYNVIPHIQHRLCTRRPVESTYSLAPFPDD